MDSKDAIFSRSTLPYGSLCLSLLTIFILKTRKTFAFVNCIRYKKQRGVPLCRYFPPNDDMRLAERYGKSRKRKPLTPSNLASNSRDPGDPSATDGRSPLPSFLYGGCRKLKRSMSNRETSPTRILVAWWHGGLSFISSIGLIDPNQEGQSVPVRLLRPAPGVFKPSSHGFRTISTRARLVPCGSGFFFLN